MNCKAVREKLKGRVLACKVVGKPSFSYSFDIQEIRLMTVTNNGGKEYCLSGVDEKGYFRLTVLSTYDVEALMQRGCVITSKDYYMPFSGDFPKETIMFVVKPPRKLK